MITWRVVAFADGGCMLMLEDGTHGFAMGFRDIGELRKMIADMAGELEKPARQRPIMFMKEFPERF